MAAGDRLETWAGLISFGYGRRNSPLAEHIADLTGATRPTEFQVEGGLRGHRRAAIDGGDCRVGVVSMSRCRLSTSAPTLPSGPCPGLSRPPFWSRVSVWEDVELIDQSGCTAASAGPGKVGGASLEEADSCCSWSELRWAKIQPKPPRWPAGVRA